MNWQIDDSWQNLKHSIYRNEDAVRAILLDKIPLPKLYTRRGNGFYFTLLDCPFYKESVEKSWLTIRIICKFMRTGYSFDGETAYRFCGLYSSKTGDKLFFCPSNGEIIGKRNIPEKVILSEYLDKEVE